MVHSQPSNRAPGLTLGDIYYVLFRQKWKIITCFTIGVLAAVALFAVRPPLYESEAKLLILSVMDSKSLSPATADSQIRSPDQEGKNIVNTEVEILRSFDLALQVVDTVGAEKIDPRSPEEAKRDTTASLVSKNLLVEVPGGGSVIRVVFQNRNREVVQPVLRELIEKYLKKHIDIHQASGVFDDFLTQPSPSAAVNVVPSNILVSAKTAVEAAAIYKSLLGRLDLLGKRQQELLTQFTEQSVPVKGVREQIEEIETAKRILEEKNPRLAGLQASNIGVIQAPTPPTVAKSKTYRMMAGAVLGGLCVGVALAFLIELKLDQSVKRPVDIESKLRLRLFLSIPHIRMNGHRRLREAATGEPLLLRGPEAEVPASNGNGSADNGHRAKTTPWNSHPALNQFHETLRDRLIVDFEVRNLTHKPKLLAVTSCGEGAGVTTVAAGLASCLSETGNGNVLLVKMMQEKAAAQQFWKGGSVSGLHEALHDPISTQVQDNLFVVTERTDGDSRRGNLPRQFTSLVPKLKASNYDYIIFDMPPVSQTSITPRLAGFVDIVVLVLESEKTDLGVAQQATALLAGSKANVCVVLNKTQTHVPPRLHQNLLNVA